MSDDLTHNTMLPPAAGPDRRRRIAYGLLVAMTVAVGAASLVISAPAWWPGHPRLTPPRMHEALSRRTRELRERQLQRLEHYAWRDRAAGQVAIPIERAMALWLADTHRRRQEEGQTP